MSYHDPEKYPKYNTAEITAELVMHGLDVGKPSMTSDCFRFGYLAAKKNKSLAQLEKELLERIRADFSNADDAYAALDNLKRNPSETVAVCITLGEGRLVAVTSGKNLAVSDVKAGTFHVIGKFTESQARALSKYMADIAIHLPEEL